MRAWTAALLLLAALGCATPRERAGSLLEEGRQAATPALAVECYTRAILADPDWRDPYACRADAYERIPLWGPALLDGVELIRFGLGDPTLKARLDRCRAGLRSAAALPLPGRTLADDDRDLESVRLVLERLPSLRPLTEGHDLGLDGLPELLGDLARTRNAREVVLLKEALASAPENIDLLTRCAALQGSLGESLDAVKLIVRAVDLRPKDAQLRLLLADAYRPLKRDQEAEDTYRYAARLSPKDPALNYACGHYIAIERKDPERGVGYLQLAVKLSPNIPLYQKDLAIARKAQVELHQDDREPYLTAMINAIDAWVKLTPEKDWGTWTDAFLYRGYGYSFFEYKGRWAVDDYDLYEKLVGKSNPHLDYLRGKALMMRHGADAVPYFEKAIAGGLARADIYQALSQACCDAGDLDKAHAAFDKAQALDPSQPVPNWGSAAQERRRREQEAQLAQDERQRKAFADSQYREGEEKRRLATQAENARIDQVNAKQAAVSREGLKLLDAKSDVCGNCQGSGWTHQSRLERPSGLDSGPPAWSKVEWGRCPACKGSGKH